MSTDELGQRTILDLKVTRTGPALVHSSRGVVVFRVTSLPAAVSLSCACDFEISILHVLSILRIADPALHILHIVADVSKYAIQSRHRSCRFHICCTALHLRLMIKFSRPSSPQHWLFIVIALFMPLSAPVAARVI